MSIKSESRFIWKFILQIFLTPITLLLILLKKKRKKDLFQPFSDMVKFIFEPKFTISMIIINILIFFISLFMGKTILNFVNYPTDLLNFRFYTLITSGFLHANLIHLFGNMLPLFIFGRVVERRFGFKKTAIIYFGAMIIGSLLESIINLLAGNNIGGLGASGAIMGIISAAILLDPFYLTYEMIIPLPIMLIGWITIYGDITGVLNPIQDGIGHFAHIGGFISVGLLLYLFGKKDRLSLKKGMIINILSFIMGIIIVLFVL